LYEDWDDDTEHSVTSGDISASELTIPGNYGLQVLIDNGVNCDVNIGFRVDFYYTYGGCPGIWETDSF